MPDNHHELVFRALADRTRQRLLRVLSEAELSVSELVEVLDQPQSTVSRHLKVLRDAGLLVDRRAGTTALYAARSTAAPPPGHGSEGAGVPEDLRIRLLRWIGEEPLDDLEKRRLEACLERRRGEPQDFFDRLGAHWDALRVEAFGPSFHLEAVTGLLPPEWSVADVGSGTGYLLPALAACFHRVIAVDPAPVMLDLARSRPDLAEAGNVEFRAGALEDLPLADGEVDLVIASLVLHHVGDPPAGIAEIHRCIRPGGRVLLIEQQPHDSDEFRERMGDTWAGFEPARLAGWLRDAGFTGITWRKLTTARPGHRQAHEVPSLVAMTAAVARPAKGKHDSHAVAGASARGGLTV